MTSSSGGATVIQQVPAFERSNAVNSITTFFGLLGREGRIHRDWHRPTGQPFSQARRDVRQQLDARLVETILDLVYLQSGGRCNLLVGPAQIAAQLEHLTQFIVQPSDLLVEGRP